MEGVYMSLLSQTPHSTPPLSWQQQALAQVIPDAPYCPLWGKDRQTDTH